jgi:drug/metabolite transporter (DMT)-like permease
MTEQDRKERAPVSIWSWVGLVVGVYGLIITGMGVYYVVRPETVTATHELNPSLWWGALMVVAGVVFLALGRKETARRGPPG